MLKIKTPKRLLAILLASGSVTLVSCSDNSSSPAPIPSPSPTPIPSPTPTPTPTPDPTPAPVIVLPDAASPDEVASQLGSGFAFAFGDGPTDEPRDPQPLDVIPLDVSGDPIDVSNVE